MTKAERNTHKSVLDLTDESLTPAPRKGIVYTSRWLVELCLDLVEPRYPTSTDNRYHILDVGCGYGQFTTRLVERLGVDARKRGISFKAFGEYLMTSVRGIEVRRETAHVARKWLNERIERIFGKRLPYGVLEGIIISTDFLYWESDLDSYDIIVGNIPYVRYDNIERIGHPVDVSDLRARFECFQGRADYSLPFLERISGLLTDSGRAAIVSSNRFTRAVYGKKLRTRLAKIGHQVHEIDVSSLRAFQSDVSAYASIFFFTKQKLRDAKYVKLKSTSADVTDKLSKAFRTRLVAVNEYDVTRRGTLPRDGKPWSNLPTDITRALKQLISDNESLDSYDFRIGKGPATGADDVFTGGWDSFPFSTTTKSSMLLPLFHWGSNGESNQEVSKYLLSVYDKETGELCDFMVFPSDVKAYLKAKQRRLKERYIVKVQGADWWRTIDPISANLLTSTKILIPDLRPAIRTIIDFGELFPAHTVVYVAGDDQDELEVLYHLLRSPIAHAFRYWQSPDMGPSSPRISTSMVRHFPVPPRERWHLVLEGSGFEGVYSAYQCSESARVAFDGFAQGPIVQ